MKNIILSIFALFIINAVANAQEFGFQKGSKFLEGNIRNNFLNDKSYDEKTRTTFITPKFGYFIKDNLAVGADLMIVDIYEKNTAGDSGYETNGLGFGVFGRYYFLNLGSRFKTYAEVGASYTNTQTTDIDNGVEISEPDYISYVGTAGLGFNFFITKRLSINYTVSDLLYARSSKNDEPGAVRDSEFELNLNVFNNIFSNSTFGFNFKF